MTTTHIHIPAPLGDVAEHVEEFVALLRGLGHEPVVAEALDLSPVSEESAT